MLCLQFPHNLVLPFCSSSILEPHTGFHMQCSNLAIRLHVSQTPAWQMIGSNFVLFVLSFKYMEQLFVYLRFALFL